jgi:O-antigen ligase
MRWQHKAAFATLGGVLAYAVFDWGGVLRSDQYYYLLALGLLAMGFSLARVRHPWAPAPSRVVRWCLALLPAYVLMQVVPLPVAAVRVLSPARAESLAALARIGPPVHFASLSVSSAATFQSFLLVCGYVVIFLLLRELTCRFTAMPQSRHPGVEPGFSPARAALKGGATEGRAALPAKLGQVPGAATTSETGWLATWPIVAIGALEAALGLCQNFGGGVDQVRWGTYVNHNHYAGFLEMALPFAVVYPVALWRRTRSRGHLTMAPALAACGVWALAGLIFAAIVNSYSRMGFIATTFSLFVMGTLALGARQLSWAARSRRRQVVTVGVVGTLALAGFVFLPPDKLIARFAQLISTDPTGEGRAQLWAETVPLIKAYPVFGCGLGGYETAFLRFKVTYPLVTDDFAHNDYLQLLAELGIVGFAIMAALAVSVVRMAVRKAVGSADPGTRYFAVACAGALAAILVHSLADFNLYIPANAMLLAWIAGMTAGFRNNPFSTADGRLTAEDVAIPVLQSPIVSQQSSIRNYRRLP